jgi:Fe-S-cluster containining protein
MSSRGKAMSRKRANAPKNKLPSAKAPIAKAPGKTHLKKEGAHPCHECTACCSYIALEIDEPTTNREYDYIRWYLFRPNVKVYVDWDGDWHLQVDSDCQHLLPNGLCGVYETRPNICRDFDWRDCEKHNDDPAEKWLFTTPEEFLTWFAKQRPKAFARYETFCEKLRQQAAEPELLRVI